MTRSSWTRESVNELYNLSFTDLLYQAQTVHRQHFNSQEVQLSTLINIKTGACPENCAYCPQSGHYKTGVQKEKLMALSDVVAKAKTAKENGATRFCMGAAWRTPPKQGLLKVLEMIREVKKLGLESCVTLGMLNTEEVEQLKIAGLDYYNHNLDTSPEYYEKIITTHTYQDRLDTLKNVANAGIKICCGGIIGLGENREDRIGLLLQLVNLPQQPESVPINRLIAIEGTPLENAAEINNFEFIRTVAVTRILLPKAYVRLSAGRTTMSEEMQALCFVAGANSIHFGEKLLVTQNPGRHQDLAMLEKLGIKAKQLVE